MDKILEDIINKSFNQQGVIIEELLKKGRYGVEKHIENMSFYRDEVGKTIQEAYDALEK
jgi:hypothetical protein